MFFLPNAYVSLSPPDYTPNLLRCHSNKSSPPRSLRNPSPNKNSPPLGRCSPLNTRSFSLSPPQTRPQGNVRRRNAFFEEYSDVEFDAMFGKHIQADQKKSPKKINNARTIRVNYYEDVSEIEFAAFFKSRTPLFKPKPKVEKTKKQRAPLFPINAFCEVDEFEFHAITKLGSIALAEKLEREMNPLLNATIKQKTIDIDANAKFIDQIVQLPKACARRVQKRFFSEILILHAYLHYGIVPFEKAKKVTAFNFKNFWHKEQEIVKDGRNLDKTLDNLIDLIKTFPQFFNEVELKDDPPCVSVIQTPGKEFKNCKVFGANGIGTSLDDAKNQAEAFSEGINGHSVTWVHVPHKSGLKSLLTSFIEERRYVTEASYIFKKELEEYLSQDSKNTAYIQCHSRGALVTRNAIEMLPPELRERINVLAIAPAAYITNTDLKSIEHVVSEADIVPYFDKKGLKKAGSTVKILKPDKKAPIWDHTVHSPTYIKYIETFRQDIVENNT